MNEIKAYILVAVENGSSIEAQSALRQVKGVTRVELTSGVYDLIVTVRALDPIELGKIRTVAGRLGYVTSSTNVRRFGIGATPIKQCTSLSGVLNLSHDKLRLPHSFSHILKHYSQHGSQFKIVCYTFFTEVSSRMHQTKAKLQTTRSSFLPFEKTLGVDCLHRAPRGQHLSQILEIRNFIFLRLGSST